MWAEIVAVDQHERSTRDLADHGKLLTDTDQVEQASSHAEHPVIRKSTARSRAVCAARSIVVIPRAPRYAVCVDLDAGGLRSGSQLLAEARVESRRRATVDIAAHADDHTPRLGRA